MKTGLILALALHILADSTVLGQMVVDSMAGADATESTEYSYYTGDLNCLDDETRCPDNSACLSPAERCDGTAKCTDGWDEQNCTGSTAAPSSTTTDPGGDYYGGCDPGQFQCPEGHCLEQGDLCNGINDCADGSDEQNCGSSTTPAPSTTTDPGTDYTDYGGGNCSPGEHECPDGLCLGASDICNGFSDCVDGSDELNCPSTTAGSTTTTPGTTTTPSYDYGCLEGEVQCKDSDMCVSTDALCDGEFDCPNNDDELNCTAGTTSPAGTTATPSYDYGCLEGEVQCKDSDMCVSMDALCDGEFDCPNNDDELNCTAGNTSTPSPITCLFEGTVYQAGATIISTNCSEVSCSQSGRILTWTNDDPTCGATTTAATSPQPPSGSRNLTAWAQTFVNWRFSLFEKWLPGMRKYIRITGVSIDSLAPPACPAPESLPCNPKSCVLDPVGCQYCFCYLSITESRSTLMAAFDRDYEFWRIRVEPIWNKVFNNYAATVN